MFFKSSLLMLGGFAMLSQAVIVDLFSDQNCQNAAGSRNVYDNTCAQLGRFQSYRITGSGAGGQQLTAFSANDCAGAYTSCVGAYVTGDCFVAVNSNGGSNAISSSPVCGSA